MTMTSHNNHFSSSLEISLVEKQRDSQAHVTGSGGWGGGGGEQKETVRSF